MNRLFAMALLALATLVAAQEPPKDAPKQAPKPWIKIVKAGNGYLVGGYIDNVLYGFEIPGTEIKSVGKGEQPLVVVDGVFLQFQVVAKSLFGALDADSLEAFRKYEQKYQAESFRGVTFSDHDFCQNAKVRHRDWVSEMPPNPNAPPDAVRTPYQVYVTFEVGDSVLMVGSAYGNEEQKRATARKIDAICRTFVRER